MWIQSHAFECSFCAWPEDKLANNEKNRYAFIARCYHSFYRQHQRRTTTLTQCRAPARTQCQAPRWEAGPRLGNMWQWPLIEGVLLFCRQKDGTRTWTENTEGAKILSVTRTKQYGPWSRSTGVKSVEGNQSWLRGRQTTVVCSCHLLGSFHSNL